MLDALWEFVKHPANRDALGWLGGGIIAVVSGLWAVIKFLSDKESRPNVKATNGAVAAGGDMTGNNFNTGVNISLQNPTFHDFNLGPLAPRSHPALDFSNDLFLPKVRKNYGEWTRYIQVVPRCLNEDGVAKCEARLLRVMALRNDNWECLSDEPFELTWASNDKTEYDLFPGVAQRLNVAWVSRTYGFIAGVDLKVCLDPRYIWNIDGPIRFDVRVLSINCSPADISIEATIVQRGTGNTPPEVKAVLRRADVLVKTCMHVY
jgi:hypothetical protein